MATVTIDPRFWKTVLRDYSQWKRAWIREAGQNSLDAKSSSIQITIKQEGNDCRITWKDNGIGMDKDTLVNKFLALGASGKEFNGSVGGFGIAKSLLCFAQKEYSVITLRNHLTGVGSDYKLNSQAAKQPGCKLEAVLETTSAREMVTIAKEWIGATSTHCLFTINGESIKTCDSLVACESKLDWCKLSLSGLEQNYVYIRIHGQMMHKVYTSLNISAVVDIDDPSYFYSNRDGLNYPWCEKLNKFMEVIFSDPKSIFETESEEIELWVGNKGSLRKNKNEPIEVEMPKIEHKDDLHKPLLLSGAGITATPASRGTLESAKQKQWNGFTFVYINKLNKPMPKPDELDEYSIRLYNWWNHIIIACCDILNIETSFNTGFCYRLDAIAECRTSSKFGSFITINPIKVVDNNIINRYDNFGYATFGSLIVSVVHELAHLQYGYHGEGWSQLFSDYIEKIILSDIKKLYVELP